MASVTVLVVTDKNPDCLRLSIETLRRHNPGVGYHLWIWNNARNDDPQLKALADRYFQPEKDLGHYHGQALDIMAQEVTTPFTLVHDNDLCHSAPTIARLIQKMRTTGAFCVCPEIKHNLGSVEHRGVMLAGQPRIDPCFSILRTPELQRLTRYVSFTPYESCNIAKFFDTGAMLRHAAEGAGLVVLEDPEIWTAVKHYGAMTWAMNAPSGSHMRGVYEHRIVHVRNDLALHDAALRADTELVVARYKEDVAWAHNFRKTVYDKSGGKPYPGAVVLPNVGREAHTYAEHVARRYDDLAEVTVFTQGNPFDHVPDFADESRKPTTTFRALGPNRLTTGPDGDPCHTGLPTAKVWEELTGTPFPGEVVFSPGACFLAHRAVLQRYPQAWWRRLADRLAAPDTQGAWPWVLERLWLALFSRKPRPHFYHNIMGWFDFEDLYEREVRAAADDAHFVEVGAYHGKSTAFLAVEIANANKRIKLDVVDTFGGSSSPGEEFMRREAEAGGGSFRHTFDANVAPVAQYVSTVVQKPSVEAAVGYADKSLDFVFLDADHSEESLTADIAAWLPKVKPGGLLAGHDLSGAWPGVERAVRKAFGTNWQPVSLQSWEHRVPT